MIKYKIIITPLTEDDGGGYLAEVPALPRCMADGETPEETLYNVRCAIDSWIDAAKAIGREIPNPEFYEF